MLECNRLPAVTFWPGLGKDSKSHAAQRGCSIGKLDPVSTLVPMGYSARQEGVSEPCLQNVLAGVVYPGGGDGITTRDG